jgi:predicted transcriptional regulator
MISEMEDEVREIIRKSKGRNYKIKVPVKALWRNDESEIENVYDGTFYDISNTHEMKFDVFMECMHNKRLGVIGFYLYGYLKYKCDQHGEFNSSVERICEEVGMNKNTTDKYLNNLMSVELIQSKGNDCKVIDGKFVKKANTYVIVG